MDDLISRQELISRISEIIGRKSEQYPDAAFDAGMECAQFVAKDLPSAERRGRWIESDIKNEKYVCSVCGGACWYYDYQGEVAKSNYCPNCGASMVNEDV